MNVKSCNSWLARISALLFAVIMALALCVSTVKAAPEEDAEQVTKLEDYTEMYGWTPGSKQQHVKVNPYLRSNAPLQAAYLAVFIEFPDCPSTHLDDADSVNAAELLLNTGGEITTTGQGRMTVPSLKQSVEKITYGKITTQSYIFPRESAGSSKVVSYVAKHPRSYYMAKSSKYPDGYANVSEKSDREAELIAGAVKAVSSQAGSAGISANQLDRDGDGCIDAISFFAEGGLDDVKWMDLLWPHKIDAVNCPLPGSPTILGKQVSSWNLIATDTGKPGAVFTTNRPGYGVVVHEYLHILGLPDLYRSSDSGDPVGYYDIMASTIGSYPQGIMAVMGSDYGDLRWHNPLQEITQTAEVTLTKPQYTNPGETNAVKIFSPYSTDEYFIAEYYARNPMEEKFASSGIKDYSDSDGLLLSRMKTNAYTNIDKEPGEDMLYVFRPGETSANQGKGSLSEAVLNLSKGRTTFGTATGSGFDNKAMCLSDGSNSGIVIEVTGQTDNTVTFHITVPDVNGAGTQDDPFLISSPDGFNMINTRPDAFYKLTKDIDFEGVTNFKPLTSIGGFNSTGVLDGNGKTIRNLTIQNGSGFFETIDLAGTVKDLNFENLNISGKKAQLGGLAARISGTVKNVCILSGTIENTAEKSDFPGNTVCAGGIAGYMGDTASIDDCQVSASVSASTGSAVYAGGLVGHCTNGAHITDSFANGSITGYTKGGILGCFEDFASGPYNSSLTGNYYDTRATGTSNSIGQASGVTVPTDAGLYAVTAPESIDLDLDTAKESDLNVSVTPASGLLPNPLNVSFGSTAIADLINGKITAVGIGTTELVIEIPVGFHTMNLKTTVNVTGKSHPDAGCLTSDLQNKVYNKTPQGVTVSAKDGITGLGALTVKYKSGETAATTEIPVNAGTYTVLADIAAGTGYLAGNDILVGTYTIEPVTLANARVSIPNIALNSPVQLTSQKLLLSADNLIAGDIVNAENCTIDFPATSAAGAFTDAAVAIGNLDNPNYKLSSLSLAGQAYTVGDRVLSSIRISQAPSKLEYIEGDTFVKDGMKVEAQWDNMGSQETSDITDAVTVTPSGALTVNDIKITVGYGGKTTEQAITVKPLAVESISITQAPGKTEYFDGEDFDPTGMAVMASYNNGKQTDITGSCTFAPSPLPAGTTEVTVTYNSFTAKQPVTVKQIVPEKLEIATPPNKITYIEGDVFDISGIQVFLIYNNGTKTDVSNDCTASKEPLKTGASSIEITYGKDGSTFKALQSITVIKKPAQLESLKITHKPDKTEYFEGDTFNPAGMVVTAVFDDGTETDVTADCRFTPSPLTSGTSEVTAEYNGAAAKQAVTVKKIQPEKIIINTAPEKTVYTEGEKFDPSGLEVYLVFNNGTKEDVTKDCSIPKEILKAGTAKVEITYKRDGKVYKTSQKITVNQIPEYSDKEIEDTDTGFKAEGSFTEDASLYVVKLKKTDSDYKALAAQMTNMEILGFYEASVTDDSYEGDITLSVPVDSRYNGKTVTVKILKDNGDTETVKRKVKDGYITVPLEEKSRIMIAVDKKTAAAVKSAAKPTTNKAADKKKTAQANGAKTGDNTPVGAFACMFIISAAGIVYIIKKRKVS